MGTYELWRMLMYGVGVFVTCNAGGMALRRAFRRAAPIVAVRVRPVNPDELADAQKPAPDKSRADKPSGDAAPHGWTPQTLSDMRRQYEPAKTEETPEELLYGVKTPEFSEASA